MNDEPKKKWLRTDESVEPALADDLFDIGASVAECLIALRNLIEARTGIRVRDDDVGMRYQNAFDNLMQALQVMSLHGPEPVEHRDGDR